MKHTVQIGFSQSYTDAGRAQYFFSSPYWQRFMRESVSGLELQSSGFAADYPGYDIVFYVDARTDIDAVQLRGVDAYKSGKRVETGVILPHPGGRVAPGEPHRNALEHLFRGVDLRMASFGFDTAPLLAAAPTWIDRIVADSAMFRSPDAWE